MALLYVAALFFFWLHLGARFEKVYASEEGRQLLDLTERFLLAAVLGIAGLSLGVFLLLARSTARPLREQREALRRQGETLNAVDALFRDLFEHS